MPSDRKPSTDQVLTNTSGGFGDCGALRVPLGDVDALDAGLPHQVRPFGLRLRLGDIELQIRRDIRASACLAKKETMPGLAPQQETAVVEPGRRAFLAASVVSRSA